MKIIGDCHGKFGHLLRIVSANPKVPHIQIGDMGLGFSPRDVETTFPSNLKFFPGNHDNRKLCYRSKNCLGGFGVHRGMFFVSGAWSIDKALRIPGISWWDDEELSVSELQAAIDLYEKTKPEIMLSHDAPTSIARELLAYLAPSAKHIPNRTQDALQRMFEAWQPKLWLFGHWHISKVIEKDETLFRCLAELEVADLPEP